MTDTPTTVNNYFIAAGMIVFVDEEAGHAQRVDTNASSSTIRTTLL